jgi:molybdenum cofactor cytidylyltransferase
VLPGDLPLICASTLLTIASELESCNVVVPVYQGQKGHPVGFGAICREDLLCFQGDKGAASIAKKYAPKLLPVDDLGVVHDVDTLADLAFAEQIVLKRAAN